MDWLNETGLNPIRCAFGFELEVLPLHGWTVSMNTTPVSVSRKSQTDHNFQSLERSRAGQQYVG